MAVVGRIPRGAELAGGGGASARWLGGVDRRGYPPMSNDGGLTRARKIDTDPHLKNISSNFPGTSPISSLPAVITPIIPEPVEETFDFFYPHKFEPDDSALVLTRTPKIFPTKKIDESNVAQIAARLLTYFSRPLHGMYEETVFNRDGSETVIRKPYTAPLPLLSEFANMQGVTERELKMAAKDFPDLARAMELAKDVLKTHLIRGGLTEAYNPAMVQFTATNETDMKVKSEQTVKRVDMNDLLDRIEQATEPQSYDV